MRGAKERQLAAQKVDGQHVRVQQIVADLGEGVARGDLGAAHHLAVLRMGQQKGRNGFGPVAAGQIVGERRASRPMPSGCSRAAPSSAYRSPRRGSSFSSDTYQNRAVAFGVS